MVDFPNFAHSTFLQAAGVAARLLNFLFSYFAHRDNWAVVTVCTIAPLLIQFANVLNVVGLGRPRLAGPLVWLYSVLYEEILLQNSLLHRFQAPGTTIVPPPVPARFTPLLLPDALVRPHPMLLDRPENL
jgi:hypothetical protein